MINLREYKTKETNTSKVLKLYKYCKICGRRLRMKESQECLLLGDIHTECCHGNKCNNCKMFLDLKDARITYNIIKEYYCDYWTKELDLSKKTLNRISELLEINIKTIEKIILIMVEYEIITKDVYGCRYYLSKQKILPKE